jgi:hypothetical protein
MRYLILVKIAFTIILTQCISSCTIEEGNTTISSFILDKDLHKVKLEITKVDSCFREIEKSTNIPLYKLGFSSDSVSRVYYRACIAGDSLIERKYCNYEKNIGADSNKFLDSAIDKLTALNIIGAWYSSDTYEFICILNSNYRNAGDERYLFIGVAHDSTNDSLLTSLLKRNKSPLFSVLDKRNNVYLLRDKRYNNFQSQPNR